MRYLFGFLCVCALGVVPLVGCSETSGTGGSGGSAGNGGAGGSAPIKSGLWLGGSPASNTDGTPFDTGWAICFNVNEDGTALVASADCDIDQDDDEAYSLEISWNDDVGKDHNEEPCNTDEWQREELGITEDVSIEDNSFEIFTGDGGSITGTFDGDTATGTARLVISPGMGHASCELDDGWTAAPAETDCTVVDDFTECRSDGMVGFCRQDLCVTMECSGLEDGTICENAVLGDGWLGVCEAGQCTKPEDCTGLPDGLICTGGDGGFCDGGECVPLP
jgi:hypothetical protein